MQRRFLRNFAKDESGGVLIYTALSSAVMLGFVGLAVDVASWYSAKRDMQSAADAAAMAGVLELARGATTTEIQTRAKDAAQLNGYVSGEVTINNPPLAGDYIGNAAFVEAVVAQDQPGFFSAMAYPGDMTVTARAVATLAGAPACVIALDPAADAALSIVGSTDVDLDCGAQANSTSSTAVDQTGNNAAMTATSIQSSGGHDCSNCTPTPTENAPPTGDPFAYLSAPMLGACDELSTVTYNSSFNGTIPAGRYCGGIVITGADINFASGLYMLGGKGLRVTGNATLTNNAGGVTFYFEPTVTGQAGNAAFIAGAASVTLSAPTTGTWNGVLFYFDPNMNANLDVDLSGGSDMALTGVIYAPNQAITYTGNSALNNTWTSIIGNTIKFTGNSYVASSGFVGGNLPLALSSPSLAE